MKVLFLSQGRTVENHPGWDWSLKKLKYDFFLPEVDLRDERQYAVMRRD